MLDCFAVFRRKGSAKRFVPAHYFSNRSLQVFALQRTSEAQGALNMINRLAGFELFQEPETLLRER